MKITDTIKYVGVNDHQVDLFEGQYKVPNGMSYTALAQYLSVDRSAMMREIKNLSDEGVLKRDGRNVELLK